MSASRCCVPNCNKSRSENLTLHYFPRPNKEFELFRSWIYAIGGDILALDNHYIFKNRRVCHLHFEERFYTRSKLLSPNAIPTLNLPGFCSEKEELKTATEEVFNVDPPQYSVTNSDIEEKDILCGTPQIPKASNKNTLKYGTALQNDLHNTVIRKSATEANDTAKECLLATNSTDKKPRDRRKVLQLRLLEDDDCDEPIYEVLPEEKPVRKVDVMTQSTDNYHQPSVNPGCHRFEARDPIIDGNVTKADACTEEKPLIKDHEVKVEKVDESSERESWKQKLALVLHTRQFCGVCLCGGGGLSALSDRLEILDGHCTTYGHVVETVFKENYDSMASSQICKSCTKKLIQSYTFIHNAKETWQTLNYHLDDLYNKTCYIRNTDLKDKILAGSKVYNAVIALDRGGPNKLQCKSVITKTSKTKLNNIKHSWARPRLKCSTCNLRLPSYRAWKAHEATTHGKDNRCRICLQSFKTRQELTAHYNTHLKPRCSICHRTVIDGRLVHHLKRRHRHSAHLCSTCNVAFYSAKALKGHINECHYSDSKCATCLQSLSEVELEEHQCRFKCPECIEAPCVHHKYLMSYREQILNLAPRARCLHCSYVCTSKGALVTHVNARHLNVQPYSCTNCGDKFYSASNLRSHICGKKKRHKYSHVCEYCDRPFNYRKMWQQHQKDCKRIQRQFQCEYCLANFDMLKDFTQHRKVKHGKDMFLCDFCDRVFLNLVKRNKHTLQAHCR